MRHVKFALASVGVLILAIGVIAAVYWPQRTVWPEFPETSDTAPQVIVQVDPDFAWRIGDVIPAEIYVKQKPGVILDINSLAIEGDFEFAGAPDVIVRDTRDGTRLVCLKVKLQSFKPSQQLSFKANLSYQVGGQREVQTLNVAAPDLFTSRTWDGRPDIKDGPLAARHGNHFWVTALALVGGIAGLVLGVLFLRRVTSVRPDAELARLTRWEQARLDFNEVWKQILMGDNRPERYKDIERILRRLYRIESRTVREVPYELGGNHPHLPQIVDVMTLCQKVLYGRQELSEAERAALKQAIDKILPARRSIPASARKR